MTHKNMVVSRALAGLFVFTITTITGMFVIEVSHGEAVIAGFLGGILVVLIIGYDNRKEQ